MITLFMAFSVLACGSVYLALTNLAISAGKSPKSPLDINITPSPERIVGMIIQLPRFLGNAGRGEIVV